MRKLRGRWGGDGVYRVGGFGGLGCIERGEERACVESGRGRCLCREAVVRESVLCMHCVEWMSALWPD